MYFRSSTHRRFPLQFDLIVINGGTDEILQSTLINLIALEKIDRSPRVAFEARVEELVRIWEARPVGKGKLHLIFVGVGDRDYSVVRPHRASHPLPFLDDLPVGLQDALAQAGERFATPVCECCDQPVNTFRWSHWISMPPRHLRCLDSRLLSRPRRPVGHFNAELPGVLRVQPPPAAELHRFTSNDAADGGSAEQVIQNIETNVPPGSAH